MQDALARCETAESSVESLTEEVAELTDIMMAVQTEKRVSESK